LIFALRFHAGTRNKRMFNRLPWICARQVAAGCLFVTSRKTLAQAKERPALERNGLFGSDSQRVSAGTYNNCPCSRLIDFFAQRMRGTSSFVTGRKTLVDYLWLWQNQYGNHEPFLIAGTQRLMDLTCRCWCVFAFVRVVCVRCVLSSFVSVCLLCRQFDVGLSI
jgi:hypothetical protein